MALIKNLLIYSLFPLFSILFGLLLIEGLLRLIGEDKQWLSLNEANIIRNFTFQYEIAGLYDAEYNSVRYVRDKFGLRGGCKEPRDIDILTVGGSTTDQRFLPLEATYQYLLQQKIYESHNKSVCISNAGVDGHTSYGHIFSFRNWFPLIPGLQPKFVLLYVGINDSVFDRIKSPMPGADIEPNVFRKNLKKFYLVQELLPLYRFIGSGFTNKSIAYAGHFPKDYEEKDYTVSKLDPRTPLLSELNSLAFGSRLEQILKEIEIMGAQPICVSQPHRYIKEIDNTLLGIPGVFDEFSGLDFDYSIKEVNKFLQNKCKENFIEISNEAIPDTLYYDGVHLTPKGSSKLAELLFNALNAKGILEKL